MNYIIDFQLLLNFDAIKELKKKKSKIFQTSFSSDIIIIFSP